LFSLCVPKFEKLLKRPLTGIPLQVIVKAANYVLQPKDTYEGAWHIEGVPQENIVASAIYYYSTNHVYGKGLEFRVKYPETYASAEQSPNDDREWSMNQYMGFFPTPPGRVLFFTNGLQHRVMQLRNSSKTEVGTRKIFCFFLVNPDKKVISTADVPPQQWPSVRTSYCVAITQWFRKLTKNFGPKEVVRMIAEFAKTGFSLEEANQHRLDLMQDRKYFRDAQNQWLERSFSLCEH